MWSQIAATSKCNAPLDEFMSSGLLATNVELFHNPEGIASYSPGLRGTSYPG